MPSKSQKQLVHRFSAFVREGGREGAIGWGRLSSEPEPTIDQEEVFPISMDPTISTPSESSSNLGNLVPRSPSTLKPHDSLLSTAVAVTFSPSAQPTLEDDEDNQDFMLEDDAVQHKARERSKGKEREVKKAKLGDGKQVDRGDSQIMKRDIRMKAKGKAKGTPPTRPVDLSEMLSEATWQRSLPETPFKHKFEVSVPPDILPAFESMRCLRPFYLVVRARKS